METIKMPVCLSICFNRISFISLEDMQWIAQRSTWFANYMEGGWRYERNKKD